MATKNGITCGKCGSVNPLGRVFCGACGGRLDLSGVTRDNVANRKKGPGAGEMGAVVLRIVALFLAIALLLTVVAMIPQTLPIGKEGSRAGAANVSSLGRTATMLGRNQTVGRRINEADINGFFYGETLKRMDADGFSVDIEPSGMRTRMVTSMGPWDVVSWRIQPKLSMEVTVIPAGSSVRFTKAKVGLLPAIGPLKVFVLRRIHAHLARLPEWAACKSIKEVQLSEDRIDVSLQKP